ncbi:hypothetical protein KBD34_00175 [Patescibacteria group bacterium]|nr:hypothetical protein [Patescibacteria group bacterium]
MTTITLKRIFLAAGGIVSLIFAYFLLSGVPGFYNPYKLDGKGIDPHKYLCDNFIRESTQCSARQYWKQVVPMAGIKTVFVVLLPFISVAQWLDQ